MATTKIIKDLLASDSGWSTSSESGLRMPKGGAFSGTAEPGMIRNDDTQDSEGSESTMQHYNGAEWKNFVNTPACTTDTNQLFTSAATATSIATYQLNNATTSIPNNTYPGTFITPAYVPGKFGNAATFNGSSSYISTGINVSTTLMTSRSYSFWFKQNSSTDLSRIFGGSNGSSTHNGMFRIREDNGTINYYSINNGVYIWSTTLVNSVWTHVALTDTSSAAKLYINGIEVAIQSVGSYTSNTNTNLQIGRGMLNSGSVGDYTNGSIDQVRIFNTALPQSAVRALYNETTTTATSASVDYQAANPNSIAYYKMSDATDQINNYNGAPANVNFNTVGKFGFAGAFNGSSSKIEISATSTTPFDPSSENFSISFWINLASFKNDGTIIAKWGSSNNTKSFFLGLQGSGGDNSKLIIYEREGGSNFTYNGTTSLTANTWHHIVYVRTGTQVLLYIDKVAQTFSASNTINAGSTEIISIGQQNGYPASTIDAKIDQIRIYDSALSADNVTTLYKEVEC